MFNSIFLVGKDFASVILTNLLLFKREENKKTYSYIQLNYAVFSKRASSDPRCVGVVCPAVGSRKRRQKAFFVELGLEFS